MQCNIERMILGIKHTVYAKETFIRIHESGYTFDSKTKTYIRNARVSTTTVTYQVAVTFHQF
jgi:hypothetical protein